MLNKIPGFDFLCVLSQKKSDLSGFSRILKTKKRFEICVNPLNPRHPRSIAVEVCCLVYLRALRVSAGGFERGAEWSLCVVCVITLIITLTKR